MSPRKGNAHDHAYEVETLQEKADRIRREQGLPPEAEETGPRPCQWYDDGRGGRFLVPGCMERVIDPDYCECGRGVVVGLLSYTNSRVLFRTAAEGTPTRDQAAADLRCLDCVADAIAEVASGEVARRMREAAQSRRGVA